MRKTKRGYEILFTSKLTNASIYIRKYKYQLLPLHSQKTKKNPNMAKFFVKLLVAKIIF